MNHRTRSKVRRSMFALGLLLALVGCDESTSGASDEAAMGGSGGGRECETHSDCAYGYVCYAYECVFQGTPVDAGDYIPRDASVPETPAVFSAPAATESQVFVASPNTDSVVRVDGQTLEVESIEVGDRPTDVQSAGLDTAVVLAPGNDELSLVRVLNTGVSVESVALPRHFNALAVDPEGEFALCYLDLRRAEPGEDTSAVQDLAVVNLEAQTVIQVAVGYKPREVHFIGDHALVVTADGLSDIALRSLTGPGIARMIPLSASGAAVDNHQVVISPDGAFAASRGPGEAKVSVIQIADGALSELALPTVPTDMVLLPSGDQLLLPLPESAEVALLTLAEVPTLKAISLMGQRMPYVAVAPQGDFALLYATGTPVDQASQVGLLHLPSEVVVFRPVRKAILGAVLDPTGQTALVTHPKAPGDPATAPDEETRLARSYAYSLLNLRTTFFKLRPTDGPVTGVAFSDDGALALVLVGASPAEVHRVTLPAFEITPFELGSPPESAGFLPAVGRGFVTQTHRTGRISFVPLSGTEGAKTVTGYTLNGLID